MNSPIQRYLNNPILKPEDMPLDCFAVYNGGAVKTDKEYIMLVRTEDMSRHCMVYAARSDDGYNFIPDQEPVVFEAVENNNKFADWSFYDPRINVVEGKFYVTYAAVETGCGCRIGLGVKDDFKTVRHVSFPLHIQNRNAVLFPEKIDGMYAMLHRAEGPEGIGHHIWISYSPDLHFWGKTEVLMKKGSHPWDISKIGAGPPPVKTDHGWLVITHAVCKTCNGSFYSMGIMLLDLKNPNKVIGRSKGMIMRPQTHYETNGFVPNVIFPVGAIMEPDNSLKIYYGAADNYQCLAEAGLDELISLCLD